MNKPAHWRESVEMTQDVLVWRVRAQVVLNILDHSIKRRNAGIEEKSLREVATKAQVVVRSDREARLAKSRGHAPCTAEEIGDVRVPYPLCDYS